MNKQTKKLVLLGSVFLFGGCEMFVSCDSGILILGNMSQGFHGVGCFFSSWFLCFKTLTRKLENLHISDESLDLGWFRCPVNWKVIWITEACFFVAPPE